jgi:hypothetical protein
MKVGYAIAGVLAIGAAGYAIYALSKKREENQEFNSRRFYNNGWNTNVNPVNVVDSALGTTPYEDNLRMALYNRWFVGRS